MPRPPAGQADAPDLRVVLLACAGWVGALAAFLLPSWVDLLLLVAAGAVLTQRARRRRAVLVLLAAVVAAGAVGTAAMLRMAVNQHGPVAALSREHAVVHVRLEVTSDAVQRDGRFAPYVLVRGRVEAVSGRGRTRTTRVPVLVIADESWRGVTLGSTVLARGRLSSPDGIGLAGVLSSSASPVLLERPEDVLRAAHRVRSAIRDSVAGLPPAQRALIPALVVGDDHRMPDQVAEAFRLSGLTHLLAVSGTNLTLVVGFLLILARWCRVRARGLIVVGALGVAGFVLLARPEPSVVRAAAMGSVALLGMGSGGQGRGVRGLGVAVLVLLLFDPWLALSVGFVLSTLATAGILFLGPPWRDALMRWLPRWLAEAIAVPMAAQLACTPVVAAISGKVSLVAVAANMLAAPAVGPATVCGLAGGLLDLVVHPLGAALGHVAGVSGWWIVAVAEHSAALPAAAVGWAPGVLSITVLAAVCLLGALWLHRLLQRRLWSVGAALLMVVVLVRPVPVLGWPPEGWVMVACDVGQGDGLVLNAGGHRGVVVDTGPDPPLMGSCLDRLHVERVPVVVLTHFHADHVDGLPAVLQDHAVGEIDVTRRRIPAEGAARVRGWAAAAGVPVRVPAYGERRRVGAVSWQVIGPSRPVDTEPSGSVAESETDDEGTVVNNTSLVLLARVAGVTILLSGDIEPAAQQALHDSVPHLRVEVLKVPHHGSRYQDPELLTALGARLAVVSVGADNDYGHPAPETITMLRRAGMAVRRTDLVGDVAVVSEQGRVRVSSHDPGP